MVNCENLTEAEKGYVAGFLDTDGNLALKWERILSGRRAGQLRIKYHICFTNTNAEVINWLKERLDCGFINTQKTSNRDCYRYYIARQKDVVKILEAILPYLRIKKKQAEIMIKFGKSRLNRRRWKASLTEEERQLIRPMLERKTKSGG